MNRADVGEQVLALFPQVGGQAVLANIGFQTMAFTGAIQGLNYESHEVSPRWTYGDTVSWTRGAHAFKFGGEYRLSSTKSTLGGSVQGTSNRPFTSIGNTGVAAVNGIARTGLAGTAASWKPAGCRKHADVACPDRFRSLVQARFINDLSGTWNDFATDPLKIRDIAQNEIGTFFKDDWKVTRDLTLNLGVRWDYYGVPWERNGLTTGLNGGGHRLFGLSGNSFDDWMKPGVRADLMEIIYVGPNSPNPDQKIYKRDLNNFGPAVGFAWQVPWFGQGKTTVRGGYQIQFLGGGRGFVLDTAIGNPPGSSNTANCITCTSSYFSLEQLVAQPEPHTGPTDFPAESKRYSDSCDGPNRAPQCLRSELPRAFRPEPHPLGDAQPHLEGDLGYAVHRHTEPQAVGQPRSQRPQFPDQRTEGSIRRGKKRRRVHIARRHVRRTQHRRNGMRHQRQEWRPHAARLEQLRPAVCCRPAQCICEPQPPPPDGLT